MNQKIYHSLAEVQFDLTNKAISCVELTQSYINRINDNKNLNVFLEVFEKSALEKAKQVDEKLRLKTSGKLAGMVIALKDNLCYKGHKVSASSKILEGFESLYNATVVERLLAEDAIIIGRTNCDEFAMGSSNENSAFGNVLNPLNTKCVPGGSSGGSAAAVAADLCLAALGTDTGGSIRQPASFCGVVGFKPTYGRVSRYGAIAYASSFDQIGPLTKTVDDAALIMEVMSGKDEYDSSVSSKPVPAYSKEINNKQVKVRIAYIKDCLENEGLNPEIKIRINELINKLRAAGHTVEAVDFPYIDYLVPTYYVLTTAEASSNLARYDGITYGYRSANATDLESTYKKSRSEGFGAEVKRRIMLGTFVLSSGYYDAYYSKGQRVRRLLQNKTNEILNNYDFILLPTTPGTAFEFGQKGADPIAMYLEDIFTVQANITGIPAISLPIGKHSNGLPFGIQVMGKKFAESELFSFSKIIQNEF
ncbi:MAG: aspartyl/glutamyl-tRNA amidotransferase subunit A [Bacteroidetes bacterium RIFCSPLOWO2_12_FULL_35_15]|nr:MAG: aspartyl/glutamyl-tRNA amidotransferase subunit A [Bacteroidetes bacterium RIFCSPLOWO2_12_FULL_35_15]